MALSIHPDAKARFDALAEEASALVVPWQPRPRLPSPAPITRDERHVEVIFAKDIESESMEVTAVDHSGRRLELQFVVGATSFTLSGEGLERLEQLHALLARQRKLYEAIGPRLLSDSLTDWLRARQSGASPPQFSDWLLQHVQGKIQPRTIVVPLENFRSQTPFTLGGVRFDHTVMTKAMFDEVEADWRQAKPEDAATIAVKVKKYRHWFQGQTCGIVTVEADASWAARSAAETVDRALTTLRLFSPSAFGARLKGSVGRVGRVFTPADVTCELANGRPTLIRDGVAEGYEQLQWTLSDEILAACWRVGLTDFDRLLVKDRLTELEEAVLEAVRLLDESVSSNAPHKRAALTLTAAESLFLQTDSEPIQVMLGLRCGHLVTSRAEDRMSLDRTIKTAYELRSGYVHHGRIKVDENRLSDLHCIVLDSLVAAARLCQTLTTRAELFEHLQQLIWS